MPALGRLRQEDDGFKVSMGYISETPHLKKKPKNKSNP
jgi:hypothetical protein